MQKGSCRNCGHQIQQTSVDRCMFCGAPLPEEQRFSESEKAQIQLRRAREEARQKSKGHRDGGGGFGDAGDVSPGFGGDDWGGGDSGGD